MAMATVMATAMDMAMTPRRSERGAPGTPAMSRLSQALVLMGVCGLACAQSEDGTAARRGISFTPTLALSGTATDNIGLESSSKDKAVIGVISPGLVVRSNSDVLRGSIDYSMDGLLYYRTAQSDRVQHRLQSQLNASLFEGRFLIDVRAMAGQQAHSALAAEQSVSPYLSNGNQSQMAMLAITPRLRGTLSGLASYDLSVTGTETRVKDSLIGDGRSALAAATIEGLGGSGRLINWSLSGSAQRSGGNPQIRRSVVDTAMLGLSYRPNMDLALKAQAGKERSNLVLLDPITSNTYGMTLNWTPTERTQISGDWRRHHYGDSHSLSFSHRMSRSSWRFSDSQTINTPGAVGVSERQTNYALYDSIFMGLEPDPIKRDLLVRAYLQNSGLSADALANSGFLSGSTSLSRAQMAAFSLLGRLSTLTLTLNESKTRRLDPFSNVPDDLSGGGALRQRSAALSFSHRLTASTSLSATAADQRTDSNRSSGQASGSKTLLASLNSSISQRLNYSLSLRHARFNSDLKSYRENAVTATLTQQFQ